MIKHNFGKFIQNGCNSNGLSEYKSRVLYKKNGVIIHNTLWEYQFVKGYMHNC